MDKTKIRAENAPKTAPESKAVFKLKTQLEAEKRAKLAFREEVLQLKAELSETKAALKKSEDASARSAALTQELKDAREEILQLKAALARFEFQEQTLKALEGTHERLKLLEFAINKYLGTVELEKEHLLGIYNKTYLENKGEE